MKRIFHHYEKWECLSMYLPIESSHSAEELKMHYADFLRDIPRFEKALQRVVEEWPTSCEQFLSNDSINRIAWLGQAAMCIETGIPRKYRAGFMLLNSSEQYLANETAHKTLTEWMRAHAGQNRAVSSAMEDPRLFQ